MKFKKRNKINFFCLPTKASNIFIQIKRKIVISGDTFVWIQIIWNFRILNWKIIDWRLWAFCNCIWKRPHSTKSIQRLVFDEWFQACAHAISIVSCCFLFNYTFKYESEKKWAVAHEYDFWFFFKMRSFN
jgi:hypothetical protein